MPGLRAAQNLQMPHPGDLEGGQMPRSSPGGGGALAQLELTDALMICYQSVETSSDPLDNKNPKIEKSPHPYSHWRATC